MPLVLKCATVIDGLDCVPFKADVILEEGRIAGIFRAAGTAPWKKDSCQVLDCSGLFLMPGMINSHVHMGMDAGPTPMHHFIGGSAYDALIRGVTAASQLVEAGFTTVRDCGGRHKEVLCLRRAVEAGLIPGPRIVSCCQAILITGGHFIGRTADGPDEVRKAAREMLAEGADFVKLMATGGMGRPGEVPGAQELTLEEICAATSVARNAGKATVAHAHGLSAIKDCARAGVSSIEHGTMIDGEAAASMARNGVFLVPTFSPYYQMATYGAERGVPLYMVEGCKHVLDTKRLHFRNVLESGVRIAYGTDAGAPLTGHTDVVTEVRQMEEAGIKRVDVVRSLTSEAAALLGMTQTIGVVREGMTADLVVLDANPLDDLSSLGRVRHVIKNGSLVERHRGG
jgi:imidazolonepropionase-like amidohydrolase